MGPQVPKRVRAGCIFTLADVRESDGRVFEKKDGLFWVQVCTCAKRIEDLFFGNARFGRHMIHAVEHGGAAQGSAYGCNEDCGTEIPG